MLYREVGEFKPSYKKDQQTFPIRLDRYGYYAILAFAFFVVPFLNPMITGQMPFCFRF